MRSLWLWISCGYLFCLSSWAGAQEAELTGKVANFVAFFTEDDKVRHERWEFSAKQTASFGMQLKTVIEGRLWWDMALMDNDYAARRSYPKAVREDELFEGEARNLYVDYMGDAFRVKIGRQIIDWTGSASPTVVDMFTPMDVRFGVSYSQAEQIIPVNALSLSHNFFLDGSLEWLLIPEGEHHRLPKGENGYGYYSYLRRQTGVRPLILKEEEIPKKQGEAEYGLRYQATVASVDFSLFGFHGHQRSPAFLIAPEASSVVITQYFPRVNTFGTSFTYAHDAWVARLLGFYEPKRRLREVYAKDTFDHDEVYDRRYVVGLGFDWVFSKHLKIYTEQYGSRLETVVPDEPTKLEKRISGYEESYIAFMRATNETFDNIIFSFEALYSAPNRSRVISPAVEFSFWDRYTFSAGARLINSEHEESHFEMLKNSSHYFARIESKINVGKEFSSQEN